jgi:Transposase protein/Helix-turn-helix domain
MSAAVAAILEGMPEPGDLRMHHAGGRCIITCGTVTLFDYAGDDIGMRNLALVSLRSLGFRGRKVAEVLGLSAAYVATLWNTAKRDGSAGVLSGLLRRGKPGTVTPAQRDQARQWRAEGASDAEIGRRLGVAHTTISRGLGKRRDGAAAAGAWAADPLPSAEPDAPGTVAAPEAGAPAAPRAEPAPVQAGEAGEGVPEPAGGQVTSRYAGAVLLHAFYARAGAGGLLAGAAGRDAALLTAVSMCFALGAHTVEQFKHLAPGEAGPLAGLGALPGLRSLRPRLAAIADGLDPLELQRAFAAAMLAADPMTSQVYYVDDHFVPYTGAKPVGKGWNNKRGRAEKGRADTHVTAHDGRAVCFVTGEPSGLSVTLPKALAELNKTVPAGTRLMIGFDRGGSYPAVFAHCRQQGAHWVSYRRAPLAVPAMLPVLAAVTVNGRTRQIAWCEETVTIKDYGQARQFTLFEGGRPVLQVLTSDMDACPADLLGWLKSRWREENFLKYASENYGIDKICDYFAIIETNSKIVANPARQQANAAVRQAHKALADAQRNLAVLLADPAISVHDKNTTLIPAAQQAITDARRRLHAAEAARDTIPAKAAANDINPDAEVAVLRAGRRGLQMVLRLLAHNAEHWLSSQLNAYLRDDDEYRAITRETIIRSLAGTITWTPAAITVSLQPPASPRVRQALALLIDQINQDPPAMPGDHRPITYQITANKGV